MIEEGLRGFLQLPDGAICMWNGGEPTLEYGSEDWHVLASGTFAETHFTAGTRPENLRGDLPTLRAILADADIRYGDALPWVGINR